MLRGIGQRDGDRFGGIVDEQRLQPRLGAEHRQHRQRGDQPGEHVQEVVVLAEQDRGAQTVACGKAARTRASPSPLVAA